MKTINIFEFSEYPGLRHCNISDDSGEEYYHKILNIEFYNALQRNEKLIVNLDNTSGFAPSFLDEAFGNLVYDFGENLVNKNLIIISDQEPDLEVMLRKETFPEWQDRRKNKTKPKKTKQHDPWYGYENDNFVTISS